MKALKNTSLVWVITLVLFLAQPTTFAADNRLFETMVPAPSLEANLLSEPVEQQLVISLPPSYFHSEERYPVVYFLHGFGGTPHSVDNFAQIADSLNETNQINEMIIVGINGNNRLGGSFYINSPVIGKWEDFVVQDVISYIDRTYRTKVQSSSRGIAGFSMGGFGAINLAFRYPDVFGVLYALAPGLFAENGLSQAMATWDQRFKNAYGAAFSPNSNQPFPYADIPIFDSSEGDSRIKSNWENGFGNLSQKIADYLSKGKTLKSIRFEVGTYDRYKWIIKGCHYFFELLTANNIPHEVDSFAGGHQLTAKLIKESILPYFSEQLEF